MSWNIKRREIEKNGISGVVMLSVLLIGAMLSCVGVMLEPPSLQRVANSRVTIAPAKATLFAGETQTFVAAVVGIEDKAVTWSVDEENGGTIAESGQYTAPEIQGVYHVTATSRARPEIKGVATVTVLTYCDPLPSAFSR